MMLAYLFIIYLQPYFIEYESYRFNLNNKIPFLKISCALMAHSILAF